MNFIDLTSFSNFVPTSVREWVQVALIAVLLITVFLFYKALMKCRNIINSYVEEKRLYDKYLEFIQAGDDFKVFSSNASSFVGDVDV